MVLYLSLIIEVVVFIMFMVSIIILVIIWYNNKQHENYFTSNNIKKQETKIYPIFLLDRDISNKKVYAKEHYLNTEEFILFTILFRTIREFRPLTCKDDLGWYHYTYHITGCVLADILWSEEKEDPVTTNSNSSSSSIKDSTTTMYIILKNLSSDEINQMYIDFVYNLKQGDFDIIKDAKIRGDIKWMIKSIDDLVGDMNIVREKKDE